MIFRLTKLAIPASLLALASWANPPMDCTGCSAYHSVSPPSGTDRAVVVTAGNFTNGLCGGSDCDTIQQCSIDVDVAVTIPFGESVDDDAGSGCTNAAPNGPYSGDYQVYSYTGNCGAYGTVNLYFNGGADCTGGVVDSASIQLGCEACVLQ